LKCLLPAHACARRFAASEQHRSRHDPERGQASDYPSCMRCPEGRAARDALRLAGVDVRWVGGGPNHRFARGRPDAPEQREARLRLERAGLLDPVWSVDEPPIEESGERAAL
jgi:hypothetical protein